jgi:hypothetical protein
MLRTTLIAAGAALCAIAVTMVVSEPVQAGSCVMVSAKGRGLSDGAAGKRADAKLDRHVKRWANKNKLTTVRVGDPSTACGKGMVAKCTASKKVCS